MNAIPQHALDFQALSQPIWLKILEILVCGPIIALLPD
jgi:hypothetical protein